MCESHSLARWMLKPPQHRPALVRKGRTTTDSTMLHRLCSQRAPMRRQWLQGPTILSKRNTTVSQSQWRNIFQNLHKDILKADYFFTLGFIKILNLLTVFLSKQFIVHVSSVQHSSTLCLITHFVFNTFPNIIEWDVIWFICLPVANVFSSFRFLFSNR